SSSTASPKFSFSTTTTPSLFGVNQNSSSTSSPGFSFSTQSTPFSNSSSLKNQTGFKSSLEIGQLLLPSFEGLTSALQVFQEMHSFINTSPFLETYKNSFSSKSIQAPIKQYFKPVPLATISPNA